MSGGRLRFDRFALDPEQRLLTCDGVPVEVSGRYLDALMLMVAEAGRLVSKDRFLDEVWRGVPVTDEALTQCVRTLRRQLGDSATKPHFIETVPKHGYRFIAPVEVEDGGTPVPVAFAAGWSTKLVLGGAGTAGAGIAGMVGGLAYGFATASQPVLPGTGATSVLLVLMSLCTVTAILGGAGVSFAVAIAGPRWAVAGGAIGGLIVGGGVKLLGLDTFDLLFGRAPIGIAGAGEGIVLGAGVGLAAWLAGRGGSLSRAIGVAALVGGASGLLVSFAGGRLMAGSMALLAERFPEARFRMDGIAAFAGEAAFGPLSRSMTAGLEGALFAACIVGAMRLVSRRHA